VKSTEFLNYTATERTKIIKTLHTTLPQSVLLGNSGFTGQFGFCEFNDTIDAMLKQFNVIHVLLDPTSQVKNQSATCKDKTLTLIFRLSDVFSDNFRGCREEVEILLNLRPVKLKAVINECDIRVAKECEPVPGKVKIDWSFTTHQNFVNDWDYVRYCRNVASIAKEILIDGKGFPTLTEITNLNQNLENVLLKLEGLYISPDMENNTHSTVGKSQTLFPRQYICVQKGDKAFLITNTDNREKISTLPGAGISVEFGLDRGAAFDREERHIQEIAASKKAHEEQYRENCITNWERDCEHTRERNERDIRDWEKQCDRVRQQNEELCPWCDGRMTKKCGHCNGSGNSGTSTHYHKCSYCDGHGQKDCSCVGFHHPGKRDKPRSPPSRPSPWSLPSKPSFVPISNINFRDGI